MSRHAWRSDGSLPSSLAPVFAPLHKAALGVAVGSTFGILIVAVTIFHVVFRPANALPLELLAQYFYGYSVSWIGVGVGLFWAFATGFVAGWFVGFVRNFMFALWLLTFRARAELSNPFLDQI